MFLLCISDGIKAQMAHAKAVNRKKNWDDDDPEGAAGGLNTPITGKYIEHMPLWPEFQIYHKITKVDKTTRRP